MSNLREHCLREPGQPAVTASVWTVPLISMPEAIMSGHVWGTSLICSNFCIGTLRSTDHIYYVSFPKERPQGSEFPSMLPWNGATKLSKVFYPAVLSISRLYIFQPHPRSGSHPEVPSAGINNSPKHHSCSVRNGRPTDDRLHFQCSLDVS